MGGYREATRDQCSSFGVDREARVKVGCVLKAELTVAKYRKQGELENSTSVPSTDADTLGPDAMTTA